MEWLNLKTSVLHAPEFIGSAPAARATWLAVSLWCASQENSGRIEGAASWGNRQWQQTCGVTRREVHDSDQLLIWDSETLVVWNYPREKEEVVRKKREYARQGGLKSGAARATGAPPGEPHNEAYASTEWKGIGKEEEEEARARLPESIQTPAVAKAWAAWEIHWSQTFKHGQPMPEHTRHAQLRELVAMGPDGAIEAIRNSIAKGTLKTPAPPFEMKNKERPDSIVTNI